MNVGAYSLIRSVPDPIRGEVFNIGIVAWSDDQVRIEVDEDAAKRAVNQSRYLAKDAWAYYECFLRDLLIEDGVINQSVLDEFAATPRGETLRLSKASFMRFPDGEQGFNERVLEIVKRLVAPIHRGGGSGSPAKDIRVRLKSLIDSKAVQQNYPFLQTRSTVPRSCEFFVNSGANVALDTLRLDLSKPNLVYERIDAEATKIADIRSSNGVRFFVYCQAGQDEASLPIVDRARKVLDSVEAEVVLSLDEASEILEREAERQQEQQTELALR